MKTTARMMAASGLLEGRGCFCDAVMAGTAYHNRAGTQWGRGRGLLQTYEHRGICTGKRSSRRMKSAGFAVLLVQPGV